MRENAGNIWESEEERLTLSKISTMKKALTLFALLLCCLNLTAQQARIPGYNDLKNSYNYQDYTSSSTDIYNPAVVGAASIIPGLGQFICGEFGRGFVFLGGTAACIGLGTMFIESGKVYNVDMTLHSVRPGAIAGAAVMFTGAAALEILSIINATRIAKVKDLYVRANGRDKKVELSAVPSAGGVTLALKF